MAESVRGQKLERKEINLIRREVYSLDSPNILYASAFEGQGLGEVRRQYAHSQVGSLYYTQGKCTFFELRKVGRILLRTHRHSTLTIQPNQAQRTRPTSMTSPTRTNQ